jgi:hypothetical protein
MAYYIDIKRFSHIKLKIFKLKNQEFLAELIAQRLQILYIFNSNILKRSS